MLKQLEEACQFIKKKTDIIPELGIILGSGLGDYAERLADKVEIPYSEIPGFHQTTVAGHAGKLVFGKVNDLALVIMQGRYHSYEGHQLDSVVFPTRVLAKLGVKNLLLTNASGGINSSYRPGDLVIINDQINLTGQNPLIGKNNDELGPRFPDMTESYNKDLIQSIHRAAKNMNYQIKEGVYAGVLGPSYETPAEIKMLSTIGADLVGMSTVHEAIAANHMQVKVAGISCVTNMAAGMGHEKLTHDDVKEVAKQVKERFSQLIDLFAQELKNS